MSYSDRIKEKDLKSIIDTAPKELKELAIELEDIQKYNQDPFFLALLLFKLSKEREETNKLLSSIEEKYNHLLQLITERKPVNEVFSSISTNQQKHFEILPEQDQKILDLIEKKGMLTAQEIAKECNYKNQNGASQRLNKLFREGHLQKIRSGKKVYFKALP